MRLTTEDIKPLGLTQDKAALLLDRLASLQPDTASAQETWHVLSQTLLKDFPFSVHVFLFTLLFPAWRKEPHTSPAWIPAPQTVLDSNIAQCMKEENCPDVKTFHQWTVKQPDQFWEKMLKKLHIVFQSPPNALCDLTEGEASPAWFPQAKLNIVDSCFTCGPAADAILYENKDKLLCRLSYNELNRQSQRIAHSLIAQGFSASDAIAICMPMNVDAIAIYLGIIRMGGVVVSIADSFSSQEISLRLTLAKAKAVFTQDKTTWGEKSYPLYEKVAAATTEKIIVLPSYGHQMAVSLRTQDCDWQHFLLDTCLTASAPCGPMDTCNILFSSGTTSEPKAIPWNHTTPMKAACDAYFHQNIQPGDVLAWPTNLGWMMGPWLIFAALINRATIAIYSGTPKEKGFGEFITQAKVTMLGVVPTLVAQWRQTQCMEGLDWQHIKVFTSTGECSNAEDMLYLMSLANYKPVIEYCGGTEIGGAYLTSTVVDKNYPSLFSTPAMGTDFVIIDEHGHTAETGEAAIAAPAIGLSTVLLNADHYSVYFADMPRTKEGRLLRRHGDMIKRLPNHYYCILGRADDNMNLGGIKVSAAEIERVIAGIPEVIETAAIAVPSNNQGPSQLIIYAAAKRSSLDKKTIMKEMQRRINQQLNPLFKIHDVVFVPELPKTASNKIMRRTLRGK